MKRLPEPDEDVLRAFGNLENNSWWEIIQGYLFDQCPGVIVEKWKARKGDMEEDTLNKGALQALDDLRYLTANAVDKWGKLQREKQLKEQREGT